ncbi:MAG: LPXTG cell wall anchor domain-containing protein [Actinomycetaceae bacterium]|nr:LPXTG cell wall anchor domain-containing protein [Actinomycetaceae bacterium]MDY6082732.1 LPXTG cell wall anchor domain-containing protein [Actinomycetaceae bacterium]
MKKVLLIAAALGALVFGTASPAAALAVPAGTQSESDVPSDVTITVELPHSNPFDDVQSPSVDHRTVTLERIAEFDPAFADGYDGSKALDKPELEGTKVTASDGVVSFPHLQPGVYRASCEATKEDGLAFAPSTVLAPSRDAHGTWFSHIRVILKHEVPGEPTVPPEIPNPSPTPSTPPHHTSQGKLPKTGATVLSLAALACAGVLAGTVLVRRKEVEA